MIDHMLLCMDENWTPHIIEWVSCYVAVGQVRLIQEKLDAFKDALAKQQKRS